MLKNAIKFIWNGTIKIISHYEEVNELIKVRITDNGAAMKESEKKQMFKMFSKQERTEAINIETIGVGLYICKRIVENSGGTISIHSEGENKGTTVSFSMKMRKLDPLLEAELEPTR